MHNIKPSLQTTARQFCPISNRAISPDGHPRSLEPLLVLYSKHATFHILSALKSTVMAGGAIKYRHLNRKSSHRQALLRNLVTSLITHESIKTTWPKAKEAQRLAEKLITLGKKNTNASKRRAEQIFFVCADLPTYTTTLGGISGADMQLV